jgi:hypothetical protein
MKIVMIGQSNVGKTTFMASMYAAMQQGVNGFTLKAGDPADHKRFLKLHRGAKASRYPAPSDQRAEYKFKLCHNGTAFFPFTWVDIRGGTILDRAESEASADLVKDLAKSDGVLVFCDAAAAARGDEDANEMARISLLVGKAITSRKRPLAIGIVFTKSDLVSEISDAIQAPILPMIDCIKANPSLTGAVIPVACGPKERDVALPVLFALCHGISMKADDLAEKFTRQHAEAEECRARANEWFGLTDWWRGVNGQRTYAQRTVEATTAAEREYAKLEPLLAPISALETVLEPLICF